VNAGLGLKESGSGMQEMQEDGKVGLIYGACEQGAQGEQHDANGAEQHDTEGVDEAERWWCKESLSERLAALLLRNLGASSNVPLSVRQMLAAMVDGLGEALNAEPSEDGWTTCVPHPFPRTTLAMVTQSIVDIRTVVESDAATAASRAKVAASDSAKPALLADAVRTTRAELDTANAIAAQRSAKLRAEKGLLAQARDAEKEANKETWEASQQTVLQREKQKQAERAGAAFSSLEASGSPRDANEANRLLRQVESHMKAARVGETLMGSALRALLPALRMKPERRTKFDEAAMSAAEGCFAEYHQELSVAQARRNREFAELQANQQRLQASIDEAREWQRAATEALRDAQDEVAACWTRVNVAQSARQSHTRFLQHLRQEAASFKTELVEIDRVQTTIRPLLEVAKC